METERRARSLKPTPCGYLSEFRSLAAFISITGDGVYEMTDLDSIWLLKG